MAQITSPSADWTFSRDERPWLLPSNRKLRNLVSISLRNLNLASTSPTRSQGKTIDDNALPQALKSPAKIVSLREQKTLGLSRSSTDLRAVAEEALAESDDTVAGGTDANGSPVSSKSKKRTQSATSATPRRPEFKRRRRRSTVEWANATPRRRQERLEDMLRERMADVFFSLHVHGLEEPVYISETVEKTMNPTFRHVDWSPCSPGVTRLESCTLRVWVRGGKVGTWRQLMTLRLDLSSLQFIGKRLDKLNRSLPSNAVLFHLNDGIYTSFSESLADYVPLLPGSLQRSVSSSSEKRSLPTSSFDALLRLSKLDDSIQDALAARNSIANDLEGLLQRNKEALNERDDVAEAEDRLKTIDFAKRTVEKQLDKAQKQQDEKRASISARRTLMASDLSSRKSEVQIMQDAKPELPSMEAEHNVNQKAIQNQRRRICEELQRCYSIEPVPGKTLAFSIQGLYLPNADHIDAEPPEHISAALGYVAHVLQLLAFYLRQALPYPVSPRGSTSTIYDPVSILKTNTPSKSQGAEHTMRTYPLFIKGVPRFRFEYGVFLINQNIRTLLENAFNLRVLDIRQTLPNLKYLLYVATAGEGELPARKAGGIRGLVRAPAMERVSSIDSAASGMSGLTLGGQWGAENGKPRGAADRLREVSGQGKGLKV
ncbi:UV radiation resistance-associated [Lecanosticta acicola]|uniref:Autophagy-related protein 14 n=1 Tax=Lecanosticta acicola TaxID=111012 RepID=A0AAI8Z7T7_9PEZI|nr:UV radiation resistance-associated [Lecanosticta acicola]